MTYRLITAILLGIIALPVVAGDVIVVPNEFAGVEAEGNSGFPWNPGTGFCIPEFRYQQMYSATQLAPGQITQIAFRRDGKATPTGSRMLNYDDVTISLSTLATSVDDPSIVFEENIGPDAVVVYQGPLTLEFGPSVDAEPQLFDVIVPFQAPFTFNPAQGDLLVDLHMSACPNDGDSIFLFFDNAEDSDVVSRVVQTPTGSTSRSDEGLITEFTYGDDVELLSPGYSGSWSFGAGRNGEGLLIEIVTVGGVRIIVVFWFTYDENGEQMWLFGAADVVGTGPIELDMFITGGPSFGPTYDPNLFATESWGTLILAFFDCLNGEASFDSVNFGSGTYDMFRLTAITGLICV